MKEKIEQLPKQFIAYLKTLNARFYYDEAEKRLLYVLPDRLTEAGADFWSSMVTNAYLFDPEVIARAVSFWRLRQINVTLDGVGETYDRIKAFKGVETGAFERVTENIRRLSEAGVRVTIRMNYDLHNLE